MEVSIENYARALGSKTMVGDDWMSATATRALILDDPSLLWFQFHGKDHNFDQDKADFSLFDFITSAGRDYEAAWLKRVAPTHIQALRDDRDVRRVQGVLKTIELMQQHVPVISHAALWHSGQKVYGASDLICLESWLYDKWPHLKPSNFDPTEDAYCVIDVKFTKALHETSKKKSLHMYGAQVRLYSYMLGHIQGQMPKRAYIVSRDRWDDPIPVEITSKLNKPLDADLADLRKRYVDIKKNGAKYLPWRDEEVKCNWSNDMDSPWTKSKERVATEFMDGKPLESLPLVGSKQAEALRTLGYRNVEDVLKADLGSVPIEQLDGIGKGAKARRIRAVLEANKSNKPPTVPSEIVPAQYKREMFIDFEFFPDLHCQFENKNFETAIKGQEMVFMIGCGWKLQSGEWHYEHILAEEETTAAEKKLFDEFLSLLKREGFLRNPDDEALWHFSSAEKSQCRRAAERLKKPQLLELPWRDLQIPVLELPLGVPGSWNFGLKSVVKALGKHAPEYAIQWPTGLGDGAAASAVGWSLYQQPKPLESKEYQLLTAYLEVDVRSMERLLAWLRDSAEKPVKPKRTASWWPRSLHMPLNRVRGGWYSEAAW